MTSFQDRLAALADGTKIELTITAEKFGTHLELENGHRISANILPLGQEFTSLGHPFRAGDLVVANDMSGLVTDVGPDYVMAVVYLRNGETLLMRFNPGAVVMVRRGDS